MADGVGNQAKLLSQFALNPSSAVSQCSSKREDQSLSGYEWRSSVDTVICSKPLVS